MRTASDGTVNVPRVEYDHSRAAGLREHLAQRCRDLIDRLTHSTETELYNFSAERSRLRDRLVNIETGRDVLVYRHEIPPALQPPREDGRIVFTLHGDRLMPPQYDHVRVPAGD
jgi:hypothetical protein